MLPNIGCGPQGMVIKYGKDDDDWMGLGFPPILRPTSYRWWCQCGHNKLLWACAMLAVGKTQRSLSRHNFLKERMAKTLWCPTTNKCTSPQPGVQLGLWMAIPWWWPPEVGKKQAPTTMIIAFWHYGYTSTYNPNCAHKETVVRHICFHVSGQPVL